MNHAMTRSMLAAGVGLSLTLALTLGSTRAQIEPMGAEAALTTMGTAFTYQGRLTKSGAPVNGTCDFRFKLWDAASGGTQIGLTQAYSGLPVSAGYFTVPGLDFGAGAFDGRARWLEIEVRCPTAIGSYTLLSPRQALMPAPHALALPGLWTQQNATSPNLIGGFHGNHVTSGVVGATIGGGGENWATHRVTDDYGTIGGGRNNQAGDDASTTSNRAYATVGGGIGNIASGARATVGGGGGNDASGSNTTISGGRFNNASGDAATVGGGDENTAYGTRATVSGGGINSATGTDTTIGGGWQNIASGNGATVGGGAFNNISGNYATGGGGFDNAAAGDYSFVVGRRAKNTDPNHDGVFIFADSTDADLTSTTPNQFLVRAAGGITMYTNAGMSVGVRVNPGSGAWSSISDRALKENVAPVNAREVLSRLIGLPIHTWNYKTQDAGVRHIGPMAQDFYAAFGVGEGDTHITTVDADGVALAAIQGLYQVTQEKDAQIAALRTQNSALQAQVGALEARLAALERGAAPARGSTFDWSALGLALLGVVGGGAWLIRARAGDRR